VILFDDFLFVLLSSGGYCFEAWLYLIFRLCMSVHQKLDFFFFFFCWGGGGILLFCNSSNWCVTMQLILPVSSSSNDIAFPNKGVGVVGSKLIGCMCNLSRKSAI
jgi:hypothetical protein